MMENLIPSGPSGWNEILAQRLPLYGHRNWIAVVDSAYPVKASPGVETAIADVGQLEAVQAVLTALAAVKHIRPLIWIDAELDCVGEDDAPGVTAYRERLHQVLGDYHVANLLHEQIIHIVNDASATYRVLVIKTDMTIPYTSVFFQLDCKYWSDAAERRLRAKLSAAPESGAWSDKDQ